MGTPEMIYPIDEDQLFRVWSVIRCFQVMREIRDPVIQSKILTDAQILLTAFVLDLQPLPGDQASAATLQAGGRFDA